MNQEDVLRFVGVTGLPGAGKGAFIELLEQELTNRGIISRYYSLSDELREEARERQLEVTRPVLRTIANELRQQQGAGVLSARVVRKVRADLDAVPAATQLVIIVDAIRNPEEVAELRKQLDERFLLVAVEAPLALLVERIAERARFDEPEEFVQKKEAARRMILGESGENEPAHGHNITQCIASADWHIDNSDSLAKLATVTRDFVEQAILSASQQSLSQQNN